MSLLAAPALAQPPKPAAATADAQEKAREHYQRARELYQAGSYREAITELEAAHELDPSAKELVFNLGVVHEKLGNIDQSLTYFRQYLNMDLEPAERAKAEALVKRLEGAKREVKPEPQATPAPQPVVVPSSPPPPPPKHGRVDALTIGAAVLTVAGLGVGIGFGAKALADAPTIPATYASPEEYLAIQRQASDAHHLAIVSDIGFGVGAASAVATAILFFARTKDPGPTKPSVGGVSVTFAGAPVAGGGSAFVVGTF